ncbi:unnamed protein product [Amoebophrya sp. A120]|nr:unnamed protein product [Amoebophrya sp. A120]|eukprot:GSA120T00024890001.1
MSLFSDCLKALQRGNEEDLLVEEIGEQENTGKKKGTEYPNGGSSKDTCVPFSPLDDEEDQLRLIKQPANTDFPQGWGPVVLSNFCFQLIKHVVSDGAAFNTIPCQVLLQYEPIGNGHEAPCLNYVASPDLPYATDEWISTAWLLLLKTLIAELAKLDPKNEAKLRGLRGAFDEWIGQVDSFIPQKSEQPIAEKEIEFVMLSSSHKKLCFGRSA